MMFSFQFVVSVFLSSDISKFALNNSCKWCFKFVNRRWSQSSPLFIKLQLIFGDVVRYSREKTFAFNCDHNDMHGVTCSFLLLTFLITLTYIQLDCIHKK